jgi:ribosomal protein L37AE/L43A
MKVQTVNCPKCGERIYSRARHDFRYCSCKYLFVDGGTKYLRFGAKDLEDIVVMEVEIDVTEKELYDDWNKGTDKYGGVK